MKRYFLILVLLFIFPGIAQAQRAEDDKAQLKKMKEAIAPLHKYPKLAYHLRNMKVKVLPDQMGYAGYIATLIIPFNHSDTECLANRRILHHIDSEVLQWALAESQTAKGSFSIQGTAKNEKEIESVCTYLFRDDRIQCQDRFGPFR